MIRTGWRIVPADKAANAFDGEGARLYGGRWNPVGIAMVYTSEHQSLAALELRVHIDKTSLRKRYKRFAFHFDDGLMETLSLASIPKNWKQEPPPPSLQQFGANWVKSTNSLILAVPSVVIPDERNFLINSKHRDFSKLKIDKPTEFRFDLRLF